MILGHVTVALRVHTGMEKLEENRNKKYAKNVHYYYNISQYIHIDVRNKRYVVWEICTHMYIVPQSPGIAGHPDNM